MDKRIWQELNTAVFYTFYLTEYVYKKKSLLNYIEVGAFIFSIFGIIGWYKVPDWDTIWMLILVLIQLIHFYRSRFLTNSDELAILEIVRNYYTDQKIELERLWQDNLPLK